MKSKDDLILAYMKQGCTITPAVAAHIYHCYALHSAISRLRAKGHNIETFETKSVSGKRLWVNRLKRGRK